MPANECIPYHQTTDITVQAGAAITGKRFVHVTADRTGGPALSTDLKNVPIVQHANADHALGVSAYDIASGALGGIIGTPGRIVPVTAGGTIAAGAAVQSDATGQAITLAAGVKLGVCLSGATSGNDAQIKLTA
jgi:hypothetical protein